MLAQTRPEGDAVSDKILEGLQAIHDAALSAGKAYVAGDPSAAVTELRDLQILVGEVAADLERQIADPEPTQS